MNFELKDNKYTLYMKATFAAALLYRRVFLSDLIQDLSILTGPDVFWTTENLEKLFGLIWAHIVNRDPTTPDYKQWKKQLPGIKAIEIGRAIASVWAMLSVSLIDPPQHSDAPSPDLDPSLSLYIYLARKMGISIETFADMIPGELLDIVNFEAKMQAEMQDPTYKATQTDYDDFFNS